MGFVLGRNSCADYTEKFNRGCFPSLFSERSPYKDFRLLVLFSPLNRSDPVNFKFGIREGTCAEIPIQESVAQSVEQRTFNPWVEGSSPSALTPVENSNNTATVGRGSQVVEEGL